MPIDRNSARAAGEVFERLLPDEDTRSTILSVVADSVCRAHRHSPANWSVTLKDKMIRLNVGRIETLAVVEDCMHLVLHGELWPEELRSIPDVDVKPPTVYKSVPGSFICNVPASRFCMVATVFEESHHALLQRAAASSRGTSWAASHSPGVLRYLEESLGLTLPDPSYCGGSTSEQKPAMITRLSYNSSDWRKPTGEACKYETSGTYNQAHGFGHEDWLFRSEWVVDGWRYAFIQGINKSHDRLVKECRPFDLTLFTIQPDKKRRYIANIRDVECLDERGAEDALEAFKQRGWYDTMLEEIRAVHGAESALGAARWAKKTLNARFRLDNVTRYPADAFADAGDPVLRLTRYMLCDWSQRPVCGDAFSRPSRSGSVDLPATTSFLRSGSRSVECTPEHARMQARLMLELQAEYPDALVTREEDFIDVRVQTEKELVLFEIKSDLEPRTVLRQALGQILEYAFHPSRNHRLPVRLVVVGRRPLLPIDESYLRRLQEDFKLPLAYRAVAP